MTDGVQNSAATDADAFKLERRVALGVGVIVVVFVLSIAWRNTPFTDPLIYRLLHIVLSLAVSTIGATLPGYLNLSYNAGGLAVRAGGALALFVLTFFGAPKVGGEAFSLAPPQLDVSLRDSNPVVDFRSAEPPNGSVDTRRAATVWLTAPFDFLNAAEPARSAVVTRARAQVTIGDRSHALKWRWFVNHTPDGTYHGVVGDAARFSVAPGAAENHEIMYLPVGEPLTWGALLDALGADGDLSVSFEFDAEGMDEAIAVSCTPDMRRLPEWLKEENPMRLTFRCLS